MMNKKVYVTKSKIENLLHKVDLFHSNIDTNNLYKSDLSKILSIPEMKLLALYRDIVNTPEGLTLTKYIKDAYVAIEQRSKSKHQAHVGYITYVPVGGRQYHHYMQHSVFTRKITLKLIRSDLFALNQFKKQKNNINYNKSNWLLPSRSSLFNCLAKSKTFSSVFTPIPFIFPSWFT